MVAVPIADVGAVDVRFVHVAVPAADVTVVAPSTPAALPRVRVRAPAECRAFVGTLSLLLLSLLLLLALPFLLLLPLFLLLLFLL